MAMEKEEMTKSDTENLISLEVNNEEIQEIIEAVPSWILRRGMTLIFCILLAILIVSAFIKYPDVVKTNLKVTSLNSPKSVMVKQTGKIISLVANDGALVKQNQALAFMESTAKHNDVLKLHEALTHFDERYTTAFTKFSTMNLNLGELHRPYQVFYQQFLQFVSSKNGGYYSNRKVYLEKELKEIEQLRNQITVQQGVQKQEFVNVEQQFEAYKKLFEKGVVSAIEYRQQENRYLDK